MSRWTSFREFWFAPDNSDLQASDTGTVSEITKYMNQNPSLQVGIDNSMDSARNQDLSDRRVSTVRDALIRAGVPADRIQTGAFGDNRLRRDGRVEVLISSIK